MSEKVPIIVGGVETFTEKTIEVEEKFTSHVLAEVCVAGEEQVENALAQAYEAKSVMASLTAYERSEILKKAVEIINSKKTLFATLIAKEAGKPWKYAMGEVERCIENITYAAEEAKRIHGETVPIDASSAGKGRRGYYERYPIGVVVAISPFNFPLNLAAHKLAPAIAAGCPVILKPASTTPLTGIELVKAFVEAGVPKGAISVLPGSGSVVGEALIKDKRVSKISFTGSMAVGEHITKTAGLKKVTMELGANCSVVVDNDLVSLDYAVKRCVLGAFYNQGQVCISVQKIFVHKDKYSEFLLKFNNETKMLKVGNPIDPDTDIGPMISDSEAERVEQWVSEALEKGASISAGGKRDGKVFEPTVLTHVEPDLRVMKEELFAPVVIIKKVESFEEGVKMANDSIYGLQTGIFTSNINRALETVDKIDTGGVMINDIPSFRVDHMPYGGNKGSGIGREGAKFAIEDMTTLRMVVFNLNKE